VKIILLLTLILVFLVCLSIYRIIRSTTSKDLKRHIQEGRDSSLRPVHTLLELGSSVLLLVWLLGSLSAVGLILLTTDDSWWLGSIIFLIVSWLCWGPSATNAKRWNWWIAKISAPTISLVVKKLNGLLGPISSSFKNHNSVSTSIYDKPDLEEFIKNLSNRPGVHLPPEDLTRARAALGFSDRNVSEIMTPLEHVRLVVASEPISPLLMDELHKDGSGIFPVVKTPGKKDQPQIIGLLDIYDLLNNLEKTEKISSLMQEGVYYINENNDLTQALHGFVASHHNLLVAVNNLEETTGVLTINQVLKELLGEALPADFVRYHDRRSVAGHDKEN
jgi:CBS domain containing-hemolysin-like protein